MSLTARKRQDIKLHQKRQKLVCNVFSFLSFFTLYKCRWLVMNICANLIIKHLGKGCAYVTAINQNVFEKEMPSVLCPVKAEKNQ